MRQKEIVKVSFIGILTNVVLVGFKAAVGFLSGSISIIMDALNNLSDALSSIITIIGMFFAGKAPDKEHPYGHGKIEYITSLIIAAFVLITGITSLYESIIKIIKPSIASYTPVMLLIILVAVFVKYTLGRFVKKRGRDLNSDSLIASGSDAQFDSIISLSTLVGALISYIFKFSIDGYLGVIISLVIIKSGYEIVADSFNNIIGIRIDSEFSKKLKKYITSYDEVLGCYDLILHQYGPEKIIGSIHIEVNDDLTAKSIHSLTRKISEDVFLKYGVILTIGIYASNTDSEEHLSIKKTIKKILKDYPTIIQFHGYYVEEETKTISIDLIFDFKEKDVIKIKDKIIDKLAIKIPDYKFNIVIDNDFSD